uniref:Uncharacterized protein n=1 Tax=Megaselia scalaris TaxID=36166 RepID=T1GAL2_MEGSC
MHSLHNTTKDNGLILISFSSSRSSDIRSTCFPHPTKNKIDYVLCDNMEQTEKWNFAPVRISTLRVEFRITKKINTNRAQKCFPLLFPEGGQHRVRSILEKANKQN